MPVSSKPRFRLRSISVMRPGDWSGAGRARDARRALAGAPARGDVLVALGEAMLDLGEARHGTATLERALAIMPKDLAALLLAGIAAEESGQLRRAARHLRHALVLGPGDPVIWHNFANVRRKTEQRRDAFTAYRRAMSVAPALVEALHNFAALALDPALRDEESGFAAGAGQHIRRAVALAPAHVGIWVTAADEALASKSFVAASLCLTRALALRASWGDGYRRLARVAESAGRPEEARRNFRRALALSPGDVETLDALGAAAADRGAAGGLSWFDRAIAVQPDYAEGLSNRGLALQDADRIAPALRDLHAAICLLPSFAPALNNLGNLCTGQRWHEPAIVYYQRTLALVPQFAEALSNRGNSMRELGRLEAARSDHRRSLTVKPSSPDTLLNLGIVSSDLHNPKYGIRCFDRAEVIKPKDPHVGWNRSLSLLLDGDYVRGFTDYEWRWHRRGITLPEPVALGWSGEPLAGRRILLYGEQGMGDALQFARFIPDVVSRGGKVFLRTEAPLKRLFMRISGVEGVVARGEASPAVDVECPLLSVPRIVGTTLETLPAPQAYLDADPVSVKSWTGRLAEVPRPRIGVCWRGNPIFPGESLRSPGLAAVAPLLAETGLSFVSLVKDPAGDPIEGMPILDVRAQLTDMAETAALMSQLDLVISSDTSVAHLAGALGRPTWVILPFSPDWRWFLGRTDSPWYPTMRLFRQRRVGEWRSVVEEVAAALRARHRPG